MAITGISILLIAVPPTHTHMSSRNTSHCLCPTPQVRCTSTLRRTASGVDLPLKRSVPRSLGRSGAERSCAAVKGAQSYIPACSCRWAQPPPCRTRSQSGGPQQPAHVPSITHMYDKSICMIREAYEGMPLSNKTSRGLQTNPRLVSARLGPSFIPLRHLS